MKDGSASDENIPVRFKVSDRDILFSGMSVAYSVSGYNIKTKKLVITK